MKTITARNEIRVDAGRFAVVRERDRRLVGRGIVQRDVAHAEQELTAGRFACLHYKEQWPVGQYAALLRLTPTRLNRLCLRIAGRSAFDIAQERLLLEASRQLTYLPASIASISYELGFQDPAYFSRLFKKRFGVSLREYRLAPRQGSTELVGTE